MSASDEYHKLKAQLEELGSKAKQEALDLIASSIETLRSLGHHYEVTERGGEKSSTFVGNGKPAATATRTSGRRTGIRDQVLQIVREGNGIKAGDIIETMGARGDKSATQSISNALAALKKAGTVTVDGGVYKAS